MLFFDSRPIALDRHRTSSTERRAELSGGLLQRCHAVWRCAQLLVCRPAAEGSLLSRFVCVKSVAYKRPAVRVFVNDRICKCVQRSIELSLHSPRNCRKRRVWRADIHPLIGRELMDLWKDCISSLVHILIQIDPASLASVSEMLLEGIQNSGNAVFMTLFGDLLVTSATCNL